MHLLRYVLLGLVLFIFSCTPKQRKENDLINKTINQYHKKVVKAPRDSSWYYLKKSETLLYKDMPDSILQEHAYLNGFYRYKVTKDYDSAFYYYEKALTFSKDTFRFQRELNYYYNLAKYYREQKKYEDALYTLNRFEKILDKDKNLRQLKLLYSEKAILFEKLELYDSVSKYNLKAIDFASKEKKENSIVTYILNEANNLFFYRLKKDKAFKLLDSLSKINFESNYLKYHLFFTRGDFYKYDDYDYLAVKNYKKALSNLVECDSLKIKLYYPQNINRIVNSYLNLGKLDSAKKYILLLKKLNFHIDDLSQRDKLKNDIKFSYFANHDFNKVEKRIDTFYDYLLDNVDKRINAKFSALEKANKNEKALLIAKQKIALKNKSLKQRQLLLLVVLLLFVFALVIFYLGYQKKQLKQSRDTLLMQQRLFRAQMNPHFTSNVLFTIQNLLHQDVQKTENYLVKFSRLLRIIFANSTKDYVSIEDELEALERYLDLQQLRFQHQFEFNLVVDNKIEQDLVKIPPMLIQPFVENAIEHGFKNLDKKGILKIEIHRLDATFLRCKITDNGNGFEGITSDKISSTKLLKELIFKLTGEKVTIISKKGKGVEISFKIPYIFEA